MSQTGLYQALENLTVRKSTSITAEGTGAFIPKGEIFDTNSPEVKVLGNVYVGVEGGYVIVQYGNVPQALLQGEPFAIVDDGDVGGDVPPHDGSKDANPDADGTKEDDQDIDEDLPVGDAPEDVVVEVNAGELTTETPAAEVETPVDPETVKSEEAPEKPAKKSTKKETKGKKS